VDQASSAVFGWGSSRWLDSRRGVARPGVRGEEATLDVRVRGRGEGPGDVCADDGRGLGRGEDATMPAHSARDPYRGKYGSRGRGACEVLVYDATCMPTPRVLLRLLPACGRLCAVCVPGRAKVDSHLRGFLTHPARATRIEAERALSVSIVP